MSEERIAYYGFFNMPHSWSFVAQQTMKVFIEKGLFCSIKNTGPNGDGNIPEYFHKYLNLRMDDPDILWSYTAPFHWAKKFSTKAKNKFAMYAYESSILPFADEKRGWKKDWGKMYECVDKVLVPSKYVKEIFENSGTPPENISIVPHGVDHSTFNQSVAPFKLNTNKKFKFLSVASNQWRKNLHKLMDVYTCVFTAKDDVCLVIKTSKYPIDPNKRSPSDCNLEKEIQKYTCRKNAPEILMLYGYMQTTAPLHTACDCYVNVSASEGFGLPLLEAMACGNITIAPRYGGVLDFMNDENSLLVDAKEICVGPQYQYWHYDPKAVACMPSWNDLADKMKSVYNNSIDFNKIRNNAFATAKKLSWENAAGAMLGLMK